MTKINILPGHLSLQQARLINENPVTIELDPSSMEQIQKSVETVQRVIEEGRVIYGINTGFGLLANTVIPNDELEELQHSIVLSHAAGIGRLMDESTIRLTMALKINSLARGYSGIRKEVIDALIALVNVLRVHRTEIC